MNEKINMAVEAAISTFKADRKDVFSISRRRSSSLVRQTVMHYARTKLHFTYNAAGCVFNRDHSTAIFSFKIIEGLLKFNPEYKLQHADFIRQVNEKTITELQNYLSE